MSLKSSTITALAGAVLALGITNAAAQNDTSVSNEKAMMTAQTDNKAAAVKDTITLAAAGKPDTTSVNTATTLKPQETCPVMGGKIDKKQYVDYQGKRIYVCCSSCKAEVSKNPDKYLTKIAALGESVEKIPLQVENPTATN